MFAPARGHNRTFFHITPDYAQIPGCGNPNPKDWKRKHSKGWEHDCSARRSGNVIAVTMSRIAMEAKRKVEDWEKTNNGKVCSLKDGTRENKDSGIKVRDNYCVCFIERKKTSNAIPNKGSNILEIVISDFRP